MHWKGNVIRFCLLIAKVTDEKVPVSRIVKAANPEAP